MVRNEIAGNSRRHPVLDASEAGMNRLTGCAISLGLLITPAASCSSAPRAEYPSPMRVTLQAGVCDTILNTQRCAQAVEDRQLPRSIGIERSDRGLCFEGIPRSCVRPDTVAEFGPASFHYLGTLERPPYHVLWAQYWEGSRILLIHSSAGTRVWVDALPVPSPDGERLAVASADLIARYNRNRLTILAAADDSLTTDWSIEPELWGPNAAWWVSDSRLGIERTAIDSLSHAEVVQDTVLVERTGGGWRLVSSTNPE